MWLPPSLPKDPGVFLLSADVCAWPVCSHHADPRATSTPPTAQRIPQPGSPGCSLAGLSGTCRDTTTHQGDGRSQPNRRAGLCPLPGNAVPGDALELRKGLVSMAAQPSGDVSTAGMGPGPWSEMRLSLAAEHPVHMRSPRPAPCTPHTHGPQLSGHPLLGPLALLGFPEGCSGSCGPVPCSGMWLLVPGALEKPKESPDLSCPVEMFGPLTVSGWWWWRPHLEGLALPFLHLGPSQPPGGIGSREGWVGAEVWPGQEGGWLWGRGGQLCPLPALPGLSRSRTCRTRGCSQVG